MISNEMADELELLIDKSFTLGSPGYEDFELSSFLTNAQYYFVKQQYDELNNRKKQGFEETEARNQSIAELINWFNCPVSGNQIGIITNGKFFDLPEDLMYTIYEECIVDRIDCDGNPLIIDVRPIAHHEVNRLKRNKYKQPKLDGLEPLTWRMQYSRQTSTLTGAGTARRHQLISDGTFTITGYRINYIQAPQSIVVDRTIVANQRNCVLNSSVHPLIVEIARDLALEIFKEQRVINKPPIDTLE